MKAVVKYGQENGMVELRDVPVPKIGPDDILLEVKAAGVCGSDIEMWRHKYTYKVNTPVIQGHEFCGVIAEIGSNVKGYSIGDRVVSETSAQICGECPFCLAGEYNLCPERLGYGYGVDGAFTQFVKVRKQILHSIPENLTFEEAAITEPFCVAYNALVYRSRIEPGDTVVIIGPGPIGLSCLQVAKVAGAGEAIVLGLKIDEKRLKIARQLRADIVIKGDEEDPARKVIELTEGLGANLVVDTAGSSTTLRQSLEMVRRMGRITKIGWGPLPVGFSLDLLISKAVTLQGAYGHNWRSWVNVLKLMAAGKLKSRALISHVFPITEWERAYRLIEQREAVKVILKPVD